MSPTTRQTWINRALLYLPFCGLALTIAVVITYSNAHPSPAARLRRNALAWIVAAGDFENPLFTSLSTDEKCRQVHKVHTIADQCAFIRQNCPTDEGVFSAYLEIYYCSLPHLKVLNNLVLAAWAGFLFTLLGTAASDFLCLNLNTLSAILGMSQSLTGVTFLAFGNGSPDVFSTFAAMSTNSGTLAVGELFGAAGFIVAVVTGAMAILSPFEVSRNSFLRDVTIFAAAVGFSLWFLIDGKLHFWECIVMVIFYVFYVGFVVCWHMWVEWRRAKREREVAARGHFVLPGNADNLNLEIEPYHDNPDDPSDSRRPSVVRVPSYEDWAALEGGGSLDEDTQYQDLEEEARGEWINQFKGNMRLTRPTRRSRRNTIAPIRPSLMGVLEYRAVVADLKKSQNLQTISMDRQRFSEGQSYATAPPNQMPADLADYSIGSSYGSGAVDENSPLLLPMTSDGLAPPSVSVGRPRAVSANDAMGLRPTPQLRSLSPVQSEADLIDFAQTDSSTDSLRPHPELVSTGSQSQRPSPAVLIEPATPQRGSPIQQTRGRSATTVSGGLLAPPDTVPINRPHSDYFVSRLSPQDRSPRHSPRLVPRVADLPLIPFRSDKRSPGSSRSTSPFPPYRDHQSPSLAPDPRSPGEYLSNPLASPESLPVDQAAERQIIRRPTRLERIWPSRFLPPPSEVMRVLFPSFVNWSEKGWWARSLAICAAIPVFALTVTLPVVEEEEQKKKRLAKNAANNPTDDAWSLDAGGIAGKGSTATAAVQTEIQHENIGRNTPQISVTAEPEEIDVLELDENGNEVPELWGRWLLVLQLFLAPFVVVFSIFLQGSDDLTLRWLILPTVICLIVSTLLLIPLFLTTTPTHRPHYYRWILSTIGFLVSIAWISLIADQVVGVLKAVAVFWNMSHAVMGLTIFAMGNSLGDLAANVTVATYGLPVMAFSACFAGPMMNILIGIGVSGCYQLLIGEERRRAQHPEKGIRFKTYHIEVSKTLIISGVTLLITLVALLIVVPLNKWRMDRKIGFGLIMLWCISTAFNVLVEFMGLFDGVESFGGVVAALVG